MKGEVWVPVTESQDETTDRLRVPGGWLHRTRMFHYERDENGNWQPKASGVSMCFQPENAR